MKLYTDIYISADPSITRDNVSSALASLYDEDLEVSLSIPDSKEEHFRQISNDYRGLCIDYWMVTHPMASWEYLSGCCFASKKEKALEEVKKHFQRKLGMLLILSICYCLCEYTHVHGLLGF